MSAHTIEQRQDKLRMIILQLLHHKSRATAREISYELQVCDVWKSPREIVSVILGDARLKNQVDVEYRTYRGWRRLVFTLKDRYGGG